MQTLATTEVQLPPELALYPYSERFESNRSYRKYAFGSMIVESEKRIEALRHTKCHPAFKIATKLHTCCKDPLIINLNSGEKYFLAEQRCKSRICPRCAKIRATELSHRVCELVRTMEAPRFVTLTMRSTNENLRDQLRRLRKNFASLRRSELWGYYVQGGIYTVEITFNPATSQWHPHIHMIIDGSYIPHGELLKRWEFVVGDSAGVDIRKVIGVRKIANYLAAYVAKSCDLSHLTPDRLAEWAIETHGLRLAQTFGSLHGIKVVAQEPDEVSYRPLGLDVNWIVTLASSGSENCRQILNHLSGNCKVLSEEFEELIIEHEFGKKGSNRKIVKPTNLQLSLNMA